MTKNRILVVEDEEDILELIRYNLVNEDYRVTCVISGENGLKKANSELPDLILLDLMLPGIDGLEVCRNLKKNPKIHHIPIIMLTARGEEADIVTGLEAGADDYITKPFSPKVMVARVKTVLRRNLKDISNETDLIKIFDIVIHPGKHEVVLEGQTLNLTSTEFRLLHFLAGRQGWVFTRDQIVTKVHGDDYPVTDRSIDVQIVGLRKKLGSAGKYIETVRGVGYRFKE